MTTYTINYEESFLENCLCENVIFELTLSQSQRRSERERRTVAKHRCKQPPTAGMQTITKMTFTQKDSQGILVKYIGMKNVTQFQKYTELFSVIFLCNSFVSERIVLHISQRSGGMSFNSHC